MNRIYSHITQLFPVCLILIGIFLLWVHPVTHVFTHLNDVASHEGDLPFNHDDDECLECVLTQLLSSEIDLSEKVGETTFAGLMVSEVRMVIYSPFKTPISPRGPPKGYV